MLVTVRVMRLYQPGSGGKDASPARRAASARVRLLSGPDAGKEMYAVLKAPRTPSFRRGALLRVKGEVVPAGRAKVLEVHEYAAELTAAALRAMLEHEARVSPDEVRSLLEECGRASFADVLERLEGTGRLSLRDVYVSWHETEVARVCELLRLADPARDAGDAYLVIEALEHRAERRGITVAELLEMNPWVLAEAEGFRFSDARVLANALGKPAPCERVAAAVVLNHLWSEARKGHSFCPRWWAAARLTQDRDFKASCGEMRTAAASAWLPGFFIGRKDRLKSDPSERLYGQGSAVPCSSFGDEVSADYGPAYEARSGRPWRFGGHALYLERAFFSEKKAAELLAALAGPGTLNGRVPADAAEGLDPWQRKAFETALNNRMCVWAGHAGSGKTHALKALVRAVQAAGLEVLVMAPSAIAAARAAEGLDVPYGTVHRWARIDPSAEDLADTLQPVGGEEAEDRKFMPGGSVQADLVVVDEMSMCGVPAFHHLLHAVYQGSNGRGVHVVLVGDPGQLPAIGPSGFFHQICRLKPAGLPVVELRGYHRSGDAICDFANAVREGRFEKGALAPVSDGVLADGTLLVLADARDRRALEKAVLRVAEAWKAAGLEPKDVLFLAPRRFDGTDWLNVLLRKVWNPLGETLPDCPFAAGDPVVAVRNDYADVRSRSRLRKRRHPGRTADVWNGTRGVVVSLKDGDPPEAVVRWGLPEGEVEVPYYLAEMPYLMEPAYALTVHKAQGGEARCVAVVGTSEMDRPTLYTAATRAREKLVLIGPVSLWEEAAAKVPPPAFTKFVWRYEQALVPAAVPAAPAAGVVLR
jgi:exodeoxyribonuclease V alpha subunit